MAFTCDTSEIKMNSTHYALMTNMFNKLKNDARELKLNLVFFLIGTSCTSGEREHEFLPVIYEIIKEPGKFIIGYKPEIELNIHVIRIDPEYENPDKRPILPVGFEGNVNLNQWDISKPRDDRNLIIHICTMAFHITDKQIFEIFTEFDRIANQLKKEIHINRMLMTYMNFSHSGALINKDDKLIFLRLPSEFIHTLSFTECLSDTTQFAFHPVSKLKEDDDFKWLYLSIEDVENDNEIITSINEFTISFEAMSAIVQSCLKLSFYLLDALVCKMYPYVIYKDKNYRGDSPFYKERNDEIDLEHNICVLKSRFGNWISGCIAEDYLQKWVSLEDREITLEKFINLEVSKIINLLMSIGGFIERFTIVSSPISPVDVRLHLLPSLGRITGLRND
jgi:hypothetical protein